MSQKYNRLGRSKLDEKLHECSERQPKNIVLQGQMVYNKIFLFFATRFHMYHGGVFNRPSIHSRVLQTYVVNFICQKVQKFWEDSNYVGKIPLISPNAKLREREGCLQC